MFLGQENWDGIWRRNQHLAAGLATRHPRSRILFLEPPLDILHALRQSTALRSLRSNQPDNTELRGNVSNIDIPANIALGRVVDFLPASSGRLASIRQLTLSRQARWQARKARLRAPWIWTQDPLAGLYAARMRAAGVIYDITDDWKSAPSFPAPLRAELHQADAFLCRTADVVITCSSQLSHGCARDDVHLVPNGVDLALFADVDRGTLVCPASIERLPSPRVGYVGTLHDDRFDAALVAAVARDSPAVSFVLVGPDLLTESSRATLASLDNVHIMGARPYSQLPAILESFSVCILPMPVTPFTSSLDPIKIREYLAARRPVVSTPFLGADAYDGVISVSEPSDFSAATALAVSTSPLHDPRPGLDVVSHESWASRIDDLSAILSALEGPDE